MQIKNILTFALVGFATAAPTDLPTITKSINAIIANLKVLDTAVTGLNAASANFPDLVSKSDAVLKAITQGTDDIKATSAISLTQALDVNKLSNDLIDIGGKVVTHFIEKKEIVVKAGKGGEVYTAMVSQRAGSVKFGAALKEKLPTLASTLVDGATAKILKSLDVSVVYPQPLL
jgi:hypothetical protein